jgi:formate-dependent nitrite reductase membrane component NrfD
MGVMAIGALHFGLSMHFLFLYVSFIVTVKTESSRVRDKQKGIYRSMRLMAYLAAS